MKWPVQYGLSFLGFTCKYRLTEAFPAQGARGLGPCQALKTSYIRYSCNFLGMLEPCGVYMGPCWAHAMLLKPAISDIAAIFGVF